MSRAAFVANLCAPGVLLALTAGCARGHNAEGECCYVTYLICAV